jgi:hypothetical protein
MCYLQVRTAILKMEAEGYSETMVYIDHTIQPGCPATLASATAFQEVKMAK